MQYLWLILLPVLFLPNLGFERQTSFGLLSLSDFIILPYVTCLLIVKRRTGPARFAYVDDVKRLCLYFVFWAILVTLMIPLRYYYSSEYQLVFSLLKLAKLTLYVTAAFLTIRALSLTGLYKQFDYSVLISSLLIAISILLSRGNLLTSPHSNHIQDIYNENIVNVQLATLMSYLLGIWLSGKYSRLWNVLMVICIPIVIGGLLVTPGRGGWLAAFAGIVYVFSRYDLRRTIVLCILGIGIVLVGYYMLPEFRLELNRTLWPDEYAQIVLTKHNAGILGFDDGKRLTIWQVEGRKFFESPLLGTGFFHRTAISGLHPSGSHNFFIQMFLELGSVGGILVILIFRKMWCHSTIIDRLDRGRSLAVKAAIVASIVACCGGEYFYGGMPVFTLLIIYATIGASAEVTFRRPYSFTRTSLPKGLTPEKSVLHSHNVGA